MLSGYFSTFLLCLALTISNADRTNENDENVEDLDAVVMVKRQVRKDPKASVLFSCGAFYNSELNLLFPPSRSSVKRIDNVTAAAIVSRESMETFCSNHTAYTRCVQEGLRNATSDIDRLAGEMVDIDNFPARIEEFCQQASRIADNFLCTFNAVNQTQSFCGAGIEDVMLRVQQLYSQGSLTNQIIFHEVCRAISSDFECTSNLLGEKCDRNYAMKMLDVYRGFFKSSCLIAGDVYPSKTMPCVEEYAKDVQNRSKDVMKMADTNPAAVIQFIGQEMDNICDNHIQTMIPCIISKLESSTKPLDLAIKRMTDYKRGMDTAKFTCSLVPALKESAMCVVGNIYNFMQKQPPCLQTAAQKISDVFDHVEEPSLDNMMEKICSGMELAVTCLKPEVSSCDAGLGDGLEEVVWRVYKCRDTQSSSASKATVSMEISMILFIVAWKLNLME